MGKMYIHTGCQVFARFATVILRVKPAALRFVPHAGFKAASANTAVPKLDSQLSIPLIRYRDTYDLQSGPGVV